VWGSSPPGIDSIGWCGEIVKFQELFR
jgi:hypothetical protein